MCVWLYSHLLVVFFINLLTVLSRFLCVFFFQAEDGIRDLVRSRGLGDVYKRQDLASTRCGFDPARCHRGGTPAACGSFTPRGDHHVCLLYTSDAADERSSVDLGGRRIIKKKKDTQSTGRRRIVHNQLYTIEKEYTDERM